MIFKYKMRDIILLFILASAQLCCKGASAKVLLPDNPPDISEYTPPDIREFINDELPKSVYHEDENEKDYNDDNDNDYNNDEENLTEAYDGFPYNKNDIESDDNDNNENGFDWINTSNDTETRDSTELDGDKEARDSVNNVDANRKSILDETDLYYYSTGKQPVHQVTKKCTDNIKWCKYWAKIGECAKNPIYMHVECRKSCALCKATEITKECTDNNNSCEFYAKRGECTKNPQYMHVECRKSCALCKVDATWSSWSIYSLCSKTCSSGTKTRTRTCSGAKSNRRTTCPGSSSSSAICNEHVPCLVDATWSSWSLYSVCSKTCSSGTKTRTRTCSGAKSNRRTTCPGSSSSSAICNEHVPCLATTKQPIAKECTDDNKSCGAWAKRGECTKNPLFMHVECRKACGLCKDPSTISLIKETESDAKCEDERNRNIECPNAIRNSPFRTVTGVCNNLRKKTWGATHTGLRRIVPADYVDGISVPRGFPGTAPTVPTANQVSQAIFNVETTNNGNQNKLAVLFMTFGQFLDHDITEVRMSMCRLKEFGNCSNLQESFKDQCFPILFDPTKPECTNFGRSKPICPKKPSKPGVRQQPNQLTAFIDASQIYGAEEELFKELRVLDDESGELKVNNREDNLLPIASVPKGFSSCSVVKDVMGERTSACRTLGGCSLVGDVRGDENIPLHSFHTVWLREHNRIARELKKMNPHWKGETVFQTARKIIGAQWQRLVYKEYLPQLINVKKYIRYEPCVNPSITQAFSAAAFRYGHSLVPNSFQQNDKNFDAVMKPVPLQEAFFNRESINFYGIEPTVFGLVANQSNEVDNNFAEGVARKLHVRPGEMFHQDLMALNIQRGRDHGLPTYGAYRKKCGLSAVNSWNDLTNIMLPQAVASFKTVYSNPNDIDLFAAGISEIHVKGFELGPTFQCLISRQFLDIRDGDRFYYENPGVFSSDQLVALQKVTMASLLCSNLKGIVSIQPQALLVPDNKLNRRVSCSRIPTLNLKPWKALPKSQFKYISDNY